MGEMRRDLGIYSRIFMNKYENYMRIESKGEMFFSSFYRYIDKYNYMGRRLI